ncbi:carboxyl-terminal processing protease CtpA [Stenomitos frigidus]|uniref:Carboxyl-terminal-processing protease n=1 Tax=Stenomitos frigidus ULC18 TaxID=2107698 RepID=A0A2T1DWQ5_9CYAN|nr:carboxyl-terminal processing protease CtpA [Stenomitos frigidus]PSB24899.1 carboxyl-terminal protease [Stenomitos frigidus ULC18]
MSKHLSWARRLAAVLLAILIALHWSVPQAQALTEEQKLLAEVWRLVDRAYVDDTFNHQNWWLVRQKAFKQPLGDREQTYAAIQQMLAGLDDPFTRLLKPVQYRSLQTNTSGELTGVGLQIASDAETGKLRVIAPIVGSPAALAGIKPADTIVKIDGAPTETFTLDEAAGRMRGTIGSRVTLTIQRDKEASFDLEVVRDRIELNPVYAELRSEPAPVNPAAASTASASKDAPDKIGYIRLSQFNANATVELAHAIERMEKQGADSYILDLRNNPGGLLQAGIEIARLWLNKGTIVYTVNRQGIQGSFEATEQALTNDPLIVLVNQGTASASEILAGALKDNGRATILGEKTFGKGLIQSLFDLSDGSGLAVTVAKYETPGHIDINKLGIKPDVIVSLKPITGAQVGTPADRQYQAAVELLTTHSMIAGAA